MWQNLWQTIQSLSGITALVGTYLIILSYERQHIFDKVRQKGIRTEGVVTRLNENPSNKEGWTAGGGKAPVVEFHTVNGHYVYASTTYQQPTPYEVGQKVDIWYIFYKSRRDMALADDVPGDTPKKLYWWGVILCGISYPMVFLKLQNFF